MTDVLADSDDTMPALAMEMRCCSIASSSAWWGSQHPKSGRNSEEAHGSEPAVPYLVLLTHLVELVDAADALVT